MTGDLPRGSRKVRIVGEDRTAVAVATKRFAGKEGGAREGRKTAGGASVVPGAKALSTVFDHYQPLFLGDTVYRVEVSAEPVERDRNDSARAGGYSGAQPGRVEGVAHGVDVDIHRPCAKQGDGFRRRDVGEARNDHLIAGPHADRHERNLERISSISDRHAVADANKVRQTLLQLLHFRSEDIATVSQHGGESSIKIRLDPFLLSGQIDEIHHCSFAAAPDEHPRRLRTRFT